MTSPFHPGIVEWSGENPGIYLKEREDGPFVSLALFFRVVTSDLGRGLGFVVLGAPGEGRGWPDVPNLCLTDNEPLMRWLVRDFVANFGAFRNQPGVQGMSWRTIASARTEGDARSLYVESAGASDVAVTLRWENLGAPFAASVPPAMSATGIHHMYSVFQEARTGSIEIGGKRLPGKVVPRDFMGRKTNTAFLAFSESWVKPE